VFSPVRRGSLNGDDLTYLLKPIWASLSVNLEQHSGKNWSVSKVEGAGRGVVQGAQCFTFWNVLW